MKKEYIAPAMQVENIEYMELLAASGYGPGYGEELATRDLDLESDEE